MSDVTREDWLKEAAKIMNKDILSKHGTQLPEIWDVGVGFPSRPKAIGQAWDKKSSADKKTHQIFISPVLGNQDVVNLMQVLLHEMIHISVGIDQKHGGEFKRVARDVGLEGRLTATYVSSGTPLAEQLTNIVSEVTQKLGTPYPHKTLVPELKEKKERAKSYVWAVSVSDPEFKVKMKKDVLEAYSLPFDAQGEQMEIVEE